MFMLGFVKGGFAENIGSNLRTKTRAGWGIGLISVGVGKEGASVEVGGDKNFVVPANPLKGLRN